MKNLKINKKLLALAIAGTIGLTSTACASEQPEPEYEEYKEPGSEYDLLTTVDDEIVENKDYDNVINGVEQILDVDGENFKLKVKYTTPEETWKITDTKELHMDVKTVNLPSNKEVYIDNVHTDTSIVSTNDLLNGILQDTMDDHIHNSQMVGFPISNTKSYYGINEIEGQNDTFIKGFCIAGLGGVSEKRRTEGEYLSYGVFANRTDSIIDLIVVDKETNEMRTVSVSSTLLIEVYNKAYMLYSASDSYGYYYEYEFDHFGNRERTGKELKRER